MKEDGMKPLRPIIAFLLFGLIVAPSANAQVEEGNDPEPGTFRIDWERQVIITHSLGVPATTMPRPAWRSTAIRAARQAAIRDLLEAVQGVTISSTTTVRNAMLESDVIRSKIEGTVHDFKILKVKYYDAYDVGMIVEMPLTGAVYDAVLPGERGGRIVQGPSTATPAAGGAVTGLIIDAVGLDVMPAMAPKILDEEGNEVYGTTKVLRNWALQQGVAGYHNNMQGARENERVSGNPMVVKALRTTGPNGCDLIISTADAERVRSAAQNQPFLEECRVMIVLGPTG